MRFENLALDLIHHLALPYIICLISGLFCGVLLAGAVFAATSHFYSLRIFRWQILDEIRRELRNPMAAYVEWLHAVSAEFSVWKNDFLPHFMPENARDRYELNRLRSLYVDPRGQLWSHRLEEYAPVLQKFQRELAKLKIRQTQIHGDFYAVFQFLDQHPPMAVEPAQRLENLAFEQSQLVGEFMHRLQHDFLTAISAPHPHATKKSWSTRPVSRPPSRPEPATQQLVGS